MTDMIERVAQAIFAEDPESLFTIHHAEVYGSAAHPAGGYVRETLLTDIIECEWVAMCDAALEEK